MSQTFNLDAILYFPWARIVKKSLAIPHFSVKDIGDIDGKKLKSYGFMGLVFDKDNTITAPYINQIYPTVAKAFQEFQSLFGANIAILSNSAGTKDDKDYEDALQIERDLGIPVLRHDRKKPGGIDEVLQYFQCPPQRLVMFGDRIFTDIVFGNRYGLLTVHTALLTEEGDNPAAVKIRRYELPLIQQWVKKGIKSPPHINYHVDICLENLV